MTFHFSPCLFFFFFFHLLDLVCSGANDSPRTHVCDEIDALRQALYGWSFILEFLFSFGGPYIAGMRFHILGILRCGCQLLVRCGFLCLAPKLGIGQMTIFFVSFFLGYFELLQFFGH